LQKSPANGQFVLAMETRFQAVAGTRRVHFGTGGHSRAHAASRDTARNVLETLDCERSLDKLPANRPLALPALAHTLSPSFAREEVTCARERRGWRRRRHSAPAVSRGRGRVSSAAQTHAAIRGRSLPLRQRPRLSR
jgi:hypothetical protein